MLPVIGIAVCGIENERQFVSQPYIHAVEQAGGFPVILPCIQKILSPDSLHFCSGFLFCGGGDITPLLMGEDPSPDSGSTDMLTDAFHLSLMKTALDSEKPILAVCRGMQVLNLAMGGSIYQDASLYPGSHIGHMQRSRLRSDPSHTVFFKKDSMLYNIFGKSLAVNSYHHQYVKDLAPHLSAAGQTSDQVVEALESEIHSFAVGVQWHPECMYDTSSPMRRLFHRFICAARQSFSPDSAYSSSDIPHTKP